MQYKVTAVYFSPTGGTKKAVQMLAASFGNAVLTDNTLPRQREQKIEFAADELLIAASPVYAGQLPQVQGLWSNLHGNGTPCVLLACYGNRHYDDTLAQLQRLLEKQGFKVIGAAAVVIPHIFSEKLGQNRPDAEDQKILRNFAEKIKHKLQSGQWAELSLPGNPEPLIKEPIPVPKTFAEEKCTMCGTCAALCPTGAIDAVTMDCDAKLCISCMRCVRYCRTGARTFNAGKISAWLEANFQQPRSVECFS